MSFPEKNIFGFPKDWRDLGKVDGGEHFMQEGEKMVKNTVHSLCNRRVHIGREADEIFTFCPRCLIKTVTSKNETDNPTT